MKRRIAIIICGMMILLTGCGKSTREVIIELGEVGAVNSESLFFTRQDGLKAAEQQNDTLTVKITKDGSYHFPVIDDSGKDIDVVLTVQKDDISVKTEDGTDVSFTIK